MTSPLALRVTLLTLGMLALSGCKDKQAQVRIKELEMQIEAIQEETNTTLSERERDMAQREDAARTAQNEAAQTIQQLTQERDAALLEATAAKKQAARAEAARLASLPKDASSPGHPDYNPANEPKITQAIAVITGDASNGTGFVVAVDDKRYLYTAAHILNGNTRLAINNSADVKFTKFGNLEAAEGTPFVRLELLDAAEAPALELAPDTTQVTVSTGVTALGAGASGAVTGERGSIFAQFDDSFDIDPTLLHGKSGGPLIINGSGRAIAVITSPSAERTELWAPAAAAAGAELANRACRLNRKLQWKPVPVATFLAEGKKIADYDNITRIAQALAVLNPTSTGLGVETTVAGGQTALAILTKAKDLPIATEVIAMNTQLASKKGRTSDADLKKRFTSLISSALSQMQRSSVGFEPAKFSSYHRRFADNSVKWRKDAIARLQGDGQE